MTDDRRIINDIEAALTHDTRIDRDRCQLEIACEGGFVSLQGKVPSIAARRLAPLLAGRVDGVRQVRTELLVERAEIMGGQEITDRILRYFLEERNIETDHIEIETDTWGRVTLRGHVHSLAQRRLCEVLSWWVPGVAEVQNLVVLSPPEEDNDEELRDNLLVILEKDRLVQPDHFQLQVRRGVVTLQGRANSDLERRAAENDCWYCPGVNDVDNRLTPG